MGTSTVFGVVFFFENKAKVGEIPFPSFLHVCGRNPSSFFGGLDTCPFYKFILLEKLEFFDAAKLGEFFNHTGCLLLVS
ncbi:MAG: hypothetical protein V3U07_06595 [Nitrospirales bacterium]